MRRREYDESDVRVRPGRSTRARTRTRPRHEQAVDAFVVAVDRGRYTCALDDGTVLLAMLARELGRAGVVVGDRVAVVGDLSGRAGSLVRIVRVAPRTSTLLRSADDGAGTPAWREKVIVANAVQLVIVSALADPPPRTGFIDRCLVAAYDAGITPLLCLTKADLAGPEAVLDYYADLGLRYVLCRPDEDPAALRTALADQLSVLVGHSGVGKSTLVNRLVPEARRAVGTVSAVGKGRHTSSSAVALPLAGGGWVIDTPGVRSFGLAHISPDDLLHGFAELADASTGCLPNCDHSGLGGDCGLDKAVADGAADPRRLASYRRLLASRAGDEPPS
ncbi:putative ribosome biogenesis GTPase RsgA [Pilimelia terevasa]|uniref:Small ribosomal subunit biogenesis GTPase RsgA n=1 Tax=Pilimelia terevasa TaxID=53372 RepID=A0A8J3BTI0_9ACTN|nr:ribosome small subunit-dependent GTPase A [Pilimelia terevasa]GGK34560.1 putative ribosome biogenesis GTPase RsgA [Pilimelia terevasa]